MRPFDHDAAPESFLADSRNKDAHTKRMSPFEARRAALIIASSFKPKDQIEREVRAGRSVAMNASVVTAVAVLTGAAIGGFKSVFAFGLGSTSDKSKFRELPKGSGAEVAQSTCCGV